MTEQVQTRMVELHSLDLELFLRTVVDDAEKILEPHLQQAAIFAAGMRLEIMANAMADAANAMGELAMMAQGPIGRLVSDE